MILPGDSLNGTLRFSLITADVSYRQRESIAYFDW